MDTRFNYRIGIDVGARSVGLAAIEMVDDMPVRILNSVVYMHDAGLDPDKQKEAITRLASAGVARRTRRLIARRKKYRAQLDKFLVNNGFPLPDLEDYSDPHFPWRARTKLVTQKLSEAEFKELFAVAVRHMIRHRGWRNPYQNVRVLHSLTPVSAEFTSFKQRVMEYNGVVFTDDVTPAEVVNEFIGDRNEQGHYDVKLRGPEGMIGGKLRQSDYANELHKIATVQGLSDEFIHEVIDLVFVTKSPKGSSASKVGMDELPGQEQYPRAEKAHPAFQRFRIYAVLTNLRIKEGSSERKLTQKELVQVAQYLEKCTSEDKPTWDDVANELGILRDQLVGTAKAGPEGERSFLTPPVNVTNQRILESKFKPLVQWWKSAAPEAQEALVVLMSNAAVSDDTLPGMAEAMNFMESLADTDFEKLEKISLPAGRAAYSVESLERLTHCMQTQGVDLHTARKLEFGVDDDWKPSAEPIGASTGNPGVDRVLKIVNRWILAVSQRYGQPSVVNIEHVRNGFMSERAAREYENDSDKRFKRNQKILEDMYADANISGKLRRSDVSRYLAIARQGNQCAYCGTAIMFSSCELDHIVPRKGAGSTNTRNNLVAVCRSCNHAKGNLPFAVWAKQQPNPEISVEKVCARVRTWENKDGFSRKQFEQFKQDVIMRLRRTGEDDEIDNRSIESVAWMARELRERIAWHFGQGEVKTKVGVYNGTITANARKASGFEGKVELIGGKGKTRLDRRHHAMDAATIALMTDGIAKTLSERVSIREYQRLRKQLETWQEYRGATEGARLTFGKWLNAMNRLLTLFNTALAEDAIPIMQNVRMRLGNAKAHDDKIRKFKDKDGNDLYREVGGQWSIQEIDRASTPQMWTALTRCPDFDPTAGLPVNSQRVLRIKGQYYRAEDKLPIFPTSSALITVRGGYAEIGNTIHHARLYRIKDKKPSYAMVRVFTTDLIRHKSKDLFTVPLAESSISLRSADPKIRKALQEGTAEYLGRLLVGDEICLDRSKLAELSGQIATLQEAYPGTVRFKVDGFYNNVQLRVRPLMLASEGLPEGILDDVQKIVDKPGWRPAVNMLFGNYGASIVYRNSLGEVKRELRFE